MTPLRITLLLASSIGLGACQTCDDFSEGLCNFQGNDMIGTVNTPLAEECQTACRSEENKLVLIKYDSVQL